VRRFSKYRLALGGIALLPAVFSLPGVRREFCPAGLCRFLEYYRAAENTNAPLTFRERVVYSLSQADAADKPRTADAIVRPDAF
jgi:hypothetical protein